eukprot:5658945-Amphidinium_carterae.2
MKNVIAIGTDQWGRRVMEHALKHCSKDDVQDLAKQVRHLRHALEWSCHGQFLLQALVALDIVL